MKIMTIKAIVAGTEYKDRVWVDDDTDPATFREAWLTLLAQSAGTPEKGTLSFSVASLEPDEDDTPIYNQLNEALARRDG